MPEKWSIIFIFLDRISNIPKICTFFIMLASLSIVSFIDMVTNTNVDCIKILFDDIIC